MSSPGRIGVDGGGSKTELVLIDAGGAVLARHTAPGCNPSHAGPEAARAVLSAALAHIRAGHPGITIERTLLCMAGNRSFWAETAAQLAGCGQVTAHDDSAPVLELATGGAPGLVLHAGTGSFVAARGRDNQAHYCGGLGWRIGDPGSGFDLARRAVAHALLELQGWEEAGPLSEALVRHTGHADAAGNTRHFYDAQEANVRLVAFAPRVLELAAAGCLPAQRALVGSLNDLLVQARLVTERLFGADRVPCGVSGAILNSPPAAAGLRALASAQAWNVELVFITQAPIEGVRRLLLRD